MVEPSNSSEQFVVPYQSICPPFLQAQARKASPLAMCVVRRRHCQWLRSGGERRQRRPVQLRRRCGGRGASAAPRGALPRGPDGRLVGQRGLPERLPRRDGRGRRLRVGDLIVCDFDVVGQALNK